MSAVKKLKHLRRLIKNIPKKNINWTRFVSRWDSEDWTECVMCAGGWIATDPFLAKGQLWIEEKNNTWAEVKTKNDMSFELAVAKALDITTSDANTLLYNENMSASDVPSHKALILEVIDDLIAKYQ